MLFDLSVVQSALVVTENPTMDEDDELMEWEKILLLNYITDEKMVIIIRSLVMDTLF